MYALILGGFASLCKRGHLELEKEVGLMHQRAAVDPRPVLVFFYGSYMNRSVLGEVGLSPVLWEPASLSGFDIRIAPRANLVRAPGHMVFGVLAAATHDELERLYTHAQTVLGEMYLPEAVLVRTQTGAWHPALCYIATDMKPAPPEADYVGRILEPARDLVFPAWYIERLESFLNG